MDINLNTISLTKARLSLLELIRRIQEEDESFSIIKRGEPTAVVLSNRTFKGLLETIEILSDRNWIKRMEVAKRELEQGKTFSWKEAKTAWKKKHTK